MAPSGQHKDALRPSTSWPATSSPISPAVKHAINRFFLVVNDPSDDGSRLYSEVFTPTGTWRSPGGPYTGRELIGATAGSWDGLVSRDHEVLKVYSCDDAGRDFMMFGNAVYVLENGATVDTQFSGRCVVDDPHSETPKLDFFQGWTDLAAMDVQRSDDERARFKK